MKSWPDMAGFSVKKGNGRTQIPWWDFQCGPLPFHRLTIESHKFLSAPWGWLDWSFDRQSSAPQRLAMGPSTHLEHLPGPSSDLPILQRTHLRQGESGKGQRNSPCFASPTPKFQKITGSPCKILVQNHPRSLTPVSTPPVDPLNPPAEPLRVRTVFKLSLPLQKFSRSSRDGPRRSWSAVSKCPKKNRSMSGFYSNLQ